MDMDLKRILFFIILSNGYELVCTHANVLFHLIAQKDLNILCDTYQNNFEQFTLIL